MTQCASGAAAKSGARPVLDRRAGSGMRRRGRFGSFRSFCSFGGLPSDLSSVTASGFNHQIHLRFT